VSPTETSPAIPATSDTRREIQVEIPAVEVVRETDKLIQKYQKLARIPGFRKGHAPASIIRQRFSQDIQNDVVDALVPRYFQKETQSKGLIPVSQPRVTDLHVHDNEPLKFKATFDVMPEIKVAGYRELRVEKAEVSVSDEEAEQSLKQLQEQRATFTTIEGTTLSEGDFAQASVDGTPQNGEGQPVHMDDVLVEIGGQNTMPEFTENLRGGATGDERTFEVNYPEDSADKRLAGKKFNYTVKIQAIKQKTLPELNDEFAKTLGEFASLEEVRKRIREGMEQERKHKAEHESKDKLVATLIKNNEFVIPESLVDRQIEVRLERGLKALVAQGMKSEDIKKMDFARLRAGQRDQAVQEVKASLLLEKIADEEKIEVGDDEIDREIDALAKQSKQTPEEIRARLTRDGALDRIRNRIRTEKTLDFLYHQSA
jgi:trigger factor